MKSKKPPILEGLFTDADYINNKSNGFKSYMKLI